jgi:hypothetical protein
MYSKHEKLLEEFMLCLNEKRYYDAHEALEEIWFPRRFEKDEEMLLLKGFINASVSLELHKLNRKIPSKKAWNTYLKYRPLLYKINSPYKNHYHFISRHLDAIYHSKRS